MIKKNNKIIIGVDHGYGYTKTAKTIIKSGIEELPIAPPFTDDILSYNGNIYTVGQKRNEQLAEKTQTNDYYILTLAAIAKELKEHNIVRANELIIAAGLPYSFMSMQKDKFTRYLQRNKNVEFNYEGKKYSVTIKGVKVYPQGFPMVATELGNKKNEEISVVDIGSRTIDVLTFIGGKPQYDKCFSIDRKGTLDCIDAISKYYLSQYQEAIDEETIQLIFQNKKVSIPDENIKFIKKFIKIYINDVIKQLEAKGIKYNVIYCGGGSTVLKNYGKEIDVSSVIKDDIFGNAKGYEMLAYNTIKN
jgi:plasmid segregation protein ParM